VLNEELEKGTPNVEALLIAHRKKAEKFGLKCPFKLKSRDDKE
jgi:hypothetical protein